MGLFGPSKKELREIEKDIAATHKRIEAKRGAAASAAQRTVDAINKETARKLRDGRG